MQKNITSRVQLKNAIKVLEIEQAIDEHLLREHASAIYESFKPVNLLKNTLKDITSSSSLMSTILSTTLGLAGGYLSKKIVVGSSENVGRKLFGSVVQYGVTNIIAQHPEAIKSFGHYVIHHLFEKKDKNCESRDS